VTPVIDVAVVDDHPIILESAASWIMADESDIRLVATAATVDALLAGPGRRADVVLLDLDLRNGTTVDANVADILAAGPAVLVLSASDRPAAVRSAIRAGARGYVLKNEQSPLIRSAIREVGAGRDWISPRLAQPAGSQSAGKTGLGALRHRHAAEIRGQEDVHQRGYGQAVPGTRTGKIRECRTCRANQAGVVLSSSRGRVSPPTSIACCPPNRLGAGYARPRPATLNLLAPGNAVMTPI
jgi:DNA-binding NarL/FixJ family response regulator